MTGGYSIQINFLPITRVPSFEVFRKRRESPEEPRPVEGLMGFSLPVQRGSEERQQYWVSFDPFHDSERFEALATDNRPMTIRGLFTGLSKATSDQLGPDDFAIPKRGFILEVHLVLADHPEGQEVLIVQPYHLGITSEFGWLVDFHFNLGDGVPFSRRVQQLSLSLDKHYRRNLDYYVDRSRKVEKSLTKVQGVLSRVCMPGTSEPIETPSTFVSLNGNRLLSKTYVFGNGKESRSQFTGLRQFGPLKETQGNPRLLFAFRERDRQAARTLAIALRGTKRRYAFPGFQELFKSPLEIDGNPLVLPDLSQASFEQALEDVNRRNGTAETVPVFILPEGEDNGYLEHKATFAHKGIATQVCTTQLIQDEAALKWAVGNIALQIFCKAGGQPWKVRPTREDTLIIGISQSHKFIMADEKPRIDRYFAFSVLTDNSGLFQELRVLGDSPEETEYLEQLQESLAKILEGTTRRFRRVVIHTSFKLKRSEMRAIQKTVEDAASRSEEGHQEFAVVKVNHKSRFFGVNPAINSKVPYEGTYVRLAAREYLLWFEGIFPDRRTVTKAFPGPTHIELLRHVDRDKAGVPPEVLLQDLVNLSGANWRGFNAKSAPVSVFYCHLVADLVHDFHTRGLPTPRVEDLKPWFL